MIEGLKIKGGAGPFEAAVIAVVLDRVTQEENQVGQALSGANTSLPAWMRAVLEEEPEWPTGWTSPNPLDG